MTFSLRHPALLAGGAAASVIALVAVALAAPTTASNRRAARRDAPALVKALVLPPGAMPSATEPVGDHHLLKPQRLLEADFANVTAHAWWVVPGSESAAFSFFTSHVPLGAKQTGSGSLVNVKTGIESQFVMYQWPSRPRVLGNRELDVTVAALPNGSTGVLAESQTDWVVTRPRSERVPAGVHEIDVTSVKWNGPTTVSLRVTDTRQIHQLTKLIDAMPIVQPVAISCFSLGYRGARTITLTFRAALGGPTLAKAVYTDWANGNGVPWNPSSQCVPIDFYVGGKRQTPLIGGWFVRTANHLLGVNLLGG